jgi:predicted DNA-binding protein with PD1-like motif
MDAFVRAPSPRPASWASALARCSVRRRAFQEQVEVLSLVGDIALEESNPKVHAHIVLGKSDGTAHGGHLIVGHVWPVLEMVLTVPPAYLRRKSDPETGLALLDAG